MPPLTTPQAPASRAPRRPRRSHAAGRAGITLVELLVVLGVLAVLASAGLAFARPSLAMKAARAVRTTVLWARTEAMWRGAPMSVTELPGGAGLVVVAPADPAAPCGEGTPLARVALADFPGVRLVAGLPRGLVWLPSGSGRTCSGGGVISGTMLLADARVTISVVVSALGRVRLGAVAAP